MAKTGPDFDPEAYAPVAERIRLFYQAHPLGRIETQLVSRTDCEIVFKALVFRTASDPWPAATGWAAEREGDGDVNLVACLENTETSAIGRALANLGFTASRERPSAEEMVRVARARARPGAERRSRVADATLDALRLLRSAQHAGLTRERAESLRARLRAGLSLHAIGRLESVLRQWMREHARSPAAGGMAPAGDHRLTIPRSGPQSTGVKDHTL